MNHWDLTVERYLEGFNALDGDLLNNGFWVTVWTDSDVGEYVTRVCPFGIPHVKSFEQLVAKTTDHCGLPLDWLISVPDSLLGEPHSNDGCRHLAGDSLNVIVVPPGNDIVWAMMDWTLDKY